MKKLIFKMLFVTVIVSGAVLTSNAQSAFEKGRINIGTCSNLGFASYSPKGGGDALTFLNMDLGGGYFIIDNLMMKASLEYAKAGEADGEFGFGLGARYYVKDMLFAEAMYSIPGEDLSNIGLGLGYVYMFNDNVSLEPMLSYDMLSYDGESTGGTLGLRVGLGIYF